MSSASVKEEFAPAGLTPAQALCVLADLAPESRVLSRRLVPAKPASSRRSRRMDRSPSAIYLNLTPLIDVVFQLLVFFIATTHFATNENVLRMDLPPRTIAGGTGAQAASSTTAPATTTDPFAYLEDALRVEVLPGGAIRSTSPVAAARNAEELRALLDVARRDSANPGGSLPPMFPIVIAPLTGTTWEDAVGALNAAAAAGFRNVSFDQQPGESAK